MGSNELINASYKQDFPKENAALPKTWSDLIRQQSGVSFLTLEREDIERMNLVSNKAKEQKSWEIKKKKMIWKRLGETDIWKVLIKIEVNKMKVMKINDSS